MYNQKVMDIFNSLENMGEIRYANAIGAASDLELGDIVKFYFVIEDGIIKEAKAKTFGGVTAIVASSVAVKFLRGMTIQQAQNFDVNKIIEYVGGFPKEKIGSVVLVKYAIEEAIEYYYKKLEKAEK